MNKVGLGLESGRPGVGMGWSRGRTRSDPRLDLVGLSWSVGWIWLDEVGNIFPLSFSFVHETN